jgi:hypothetical protein
MTVNQKYKIKRPISIWATLLMATLGTRDRPGSRKSWTGDSIRVMAIVNMRIFWSRARLPIFII